MRSSSASTGKGFPLSCSGAIAVVDVVVAREVLSDGDGV